MGPRFSTPKHKAQGRRKDVPELSLYEQLGDPAEITKSIAINKVLNKAREQEEMKVKLLVLGTEDSGKYDLFKTMRILYGSPRSEDELRMCGVVVRSNVVETMRRLCTHLRNRGFEQDLDEESANHSTAHSNHSGANSQDGMTPRYAYDELMDNIVKTSADSSQVSPFEGGNQQRSDFVLDWAVESPQAGIFANKDAKLFLKHSEAIRVLWQSSTMRKVWVEREAVTVRGEQKEFLQDISRISSPQYRPTTQDINLARFVGVPVVVDRYRIDGIDHEMYSVSIQSKENNRKRHTMEHFDNVDAVIFVASLSDYDESSEEGINCMVESLELFRSVCNHHLFKDKPIVLFLNKKDAFAEKIIRSDIAAQRPFNDYAGPARDFDHGVLYFIEKFKSCSADDSINDSLIHVTCASDTNNQEFVLDSVRTILMMDNLRKGGYLGS